MPGRNRPTFFFDYVDPLSYLMERVLTEGCGLPPAARENHPLELRAPPAPRLTPEDPSWSRRWVTLAETSSPGAVPPVHPTLVPFSRKAHELAFHARSRGRFEEIHRALFDAYFTRRLDIGRIDVLVDLAREQGLDAMEAKAALDVDRHREAVEEARDRARREGVQDVPALLWGDRAFHGRPDVERVRAFLAHSPDSVHFDP